MIPLQRITLDKEHRKEGEDDQRDNLLNDFELPQRERASKLMAADAVSRHLKAVLEECNTPADKYDGNNAVTLQTRLKGDMTIPCQGHKDIGADKKSYGCNALY